MTYAELGAPGGVQVPHELLEYLKNSQEPRRYALEAVGHARMFGASKLASDFVVGDEYEKHVGRWDPNHPDHRVCQVEFSIGAAVTIPQYNLGNTGATFGLRFPVNVLQIVISPNILEEKPQPFVKEDMIRNAKDVFSSAVRNVFLKLAAMSGDKYGFIGPVFGKDPRTGTKGVVIGTSGGFMMSTPKGDQVLEDKCKKYEQ